MRVLMDECSSVDMSAGFTGVRHDFVSPSTSVFLYQCRFDHEDLHAFYMPAFCSMLLLVEVAWFL